jgi:NAD(P)-dependent dehydrogenase (short-subunit alcohol dehydrogenase family)
MTQTMPATAQQQDPPRRTALVTGGSNGMGRAIAQRFLELGFEVMATGRTAASLDEAEAMLGPGARVVASDAGDLAAITALASQVTAEFGQLDVLVLNAGRAENVSFADVTEAGFDQTMAVDLKGPFFAVQRLAPVVRDGGAIVLTTSIGNVMGRTGFHDYDAAKAGLRSLTRGLAAELMPRGIRVNAVSPGGINTSVIDRAPLPDETKADLIHGLIEASPMKRLGTGDEIAAAVEFLALHATYTTGAELPVDGGWSQL